MAALFGLEKQEVVRIKVKKCDGLLQPIYKKLCVDPQLTSFEILRNLLARAFDIKEEFTISYLAKDENSQDAYLALLSDWDLDAAFLSASDPCLRLKVDLRPFEEGLEDWDIVAPTDSSARNGAQAGDGGSLLGTITGTITSSVGKTVSTVSKAIGLKSETEEGQLKPVKPPMSDAEFHNFLDAVGHLIRPEEFRLSVYLGGVEPALRSVVWRHLLNVYPEGLSGRERFEYLKKKSNEYYKLRDDWRQLFSSGKGTEEIKFITNMVKKDVLRTDRSHPFYAGSDENANVLSLFNILVTFALTHPDVSYCQGMSDIASPLLVVQKDEAYAYICLCGLMKRLGANFLLDGLAITVKLQHLALLLQHRDMEFYNYLKKHDADDMFFCYRWLLLEMKREFPFDDALHMLEVMWSSLPPDPPENEIRLSNSDYTPARLTCSPISPSLANHAHMYMRMRSLRKQANLKAQGNEQLESGDEAAVVHKRKPILPPLAVTPAEEKDIDPKEYLPVEDLATQELQGKSTTIDKSLETPPPSAIGDGEPKFIKAKIMINGSPISPEMDGCENHGKQHEASPGHSPERNGPGAAEEKPRVEASETDCSGASGSSSHVEGKGAPDKARNNNSFDAASDQKQQQKQASSSEESAVSSSPSTGSMAPGSPKRPTDIPVKPAYNGSAQNQAHPPPPSATSSTSGGGESLNVLVSSESGITERTMDLVELNSCEEAVENPAIDFAQMPGSLPKLPAPGEFGYGNPYLIFLCLTLLLQQRDHIMRNRMDYNDLAMHFDKLVRRHNVYRVLHQAKSLYAVYLRSQAQAAQQESSSGSDDVSV